MPYNIQGSGLSDGVMASELNMDFSRQPQNRTFCMISEKAIDHQVGKTHARIGAELAATQKEIRGK